LDCQNLLAYPQTTDLYHQLLAYPQEIVLNVMDFVVTTVFQELYGNNPLFASASFKVRPYNIGKTINLRELNPHGSLQKTETYIL
jgi:DNA replication licensing factor MCM4